MNKIELMGLLNPKNDTKEEYRNCLKIFYRQLKKAKESNEYIWSEFKDNLSSYTTYIPYIHIGLLKQDYESVCDIIKSILYFDNENGRIFQKRDKYALLFLLEKEFEKDENI